jgi:hypothetical protein
MDAEIMAIFVIVPPETPDELECMQYSQISAIYVKLENVIV